MKNKNAEHLCCTLQQREQQVHIMLLQVLDNDVSKGLCPANKVVCLIVDECHRAVGNAPVVNALRGIHTTRGAALRVIGLSATPGSQPEKIQEVIKNLRISRVRFYSHQHAEVKLYRHRISEDVRTVKVWSFRW